MDKFGLIGYPIAHSLSPRLFSAAYGGKYAYELIETPDFEKAWECFMHGYKAINVTAPFKGDAFDAADWHSPECERVGATNLCVNDGGAVRAYNSDYLGVKALLERLGRGTAAVIGFGGAGKAALAAAEDSGFSTSLYRHDEIAGGVRADVIIYTLPKGNRQARMRKPYRSQLQGPLPRLAPGLHPGHRLAPAAGGSRLFADDRRETGRQSDGNPLPPAGKSLTSACIIAGCCLYSR